MCLVELDYWFKDLCWTQTHIYTTQGCVYKQGVWSVWIGDPLVCLQYQEHGTHTQSGLDLLWAHSVSTLKTLLPDSLTLKVHAKKIKKVIYTSQHCESSNLFFQFFLPTKHIITTFLANKAYYYIQLCDKRGRGGRKTLEHKWTCILYIHYSNRILARAKEYNSYYSSGKNRWSSYLGNRDSLSCLSWLVGCCAPRNPCL